MKPLIALFRGINVGGKNLLPMKELVQLFEDAGAANIKTYINSGNVVFAGPQSMGSQLSAMLGSKIKAKYGFEPALHILELKDIESAISGKPFPEAASTPEFLHAGFLAAKPKNPDMKKLASLKSQSEQFCLTDRIFYLHAPEGVGRSKLVANCEKILGVSMTDRNWRTVCRLRDLAYEIVKLGRAL